MITTLRQAISRVKRDEKGAAAVEFALVIPIMLTLYLGTMEISQGIEVNKKVGRASSLVTDLITQQPVITRAELSAIADISAGALAPYNRATPTIEMWGIQVTNETPPKARVTWSLKKTGSAMSRINLPGTPVTIPQRLMIPNTFIVKGGLKVDYVPITTYTVNGTTASGNKGIDMGEYYYLRPRASPDIVCTDC